MKSENKVKIRNILIVLSIICFFIVASIVAISIANGKRLNEDGQLVDTSIIRINSSPGDLTAYIDGERVRIVENRIESLTPGEVLLRLEKEGYNSWEKQVLIEPGIVKDVYVRLYPEELEFEQITNTNVHNIFFSKNTEFVFYTVLNSDIKSDIGLWKIKLSQNLLNIGDNTPEKIADFESSTLKILRENSYSISVSPDNNRLILSIPDQEIIRLYDTNSNSDYLDLKRELGYIPSNYKWFRNSDSLIVQKDNIIFEYEISSKQSNLIHIFGDEGVIYGVNANTVYYYRGDLGRIYKYINKNSEFVKLPRLFEVPENITNILSHHINSDIIIIETEDNKYFFDLQKDFIDNFGQQSEILQISGNAKSVIYKNDSGYYTYVLENTFNNKSYNTANKKIQIQDENVENIYFTPDGGNIIAFVNNDEDRTLWIADFDGQNAREIINEQTISGNISQTTNDGNALILLLQDTSLDENSENSRKNIYRIDLEVSN